MCWTSDRRLSPILPISVTQVRVQKFQEGIEIFPTVVEDDPFHLYTILRQNILIRLARFMFGSRILSTQFHQHLEDEFEGITGADASHVKFVLLRISAWKLTEAGMFIIVQLDGDSHPCLRITPV